MATEMGGGLEGLHLEHHGGDVADARIERAVVEEDDFPLEIARAGKDGRGAGEEIDRGGGDALGQLQFEPQTVFIEGRHGLKACGGVSASRSVGELARHCADTPTRRFSDTISSSFAYGVGAGGLALIEPPRMR